MNKNKITLINGTVLSVDKMNSFFPDGAIVVSDGKIEKIGSAGDIKPEGEIIDMNGKLILPGLINTHTHTHSTLFRNAADDLKLMDWLNKVIWSAEKYLTEERSYRATSLSCLEMLQNGITTYADQYYYAQITAKAAAESGLRAFIAPSVFTKPSPETDNTLEKAVDFIESYKNKPDSKIYPCIGPHAPYSVHDELWKQVVEIAKKDDLIIHTHISETLDENQQIKEQTGISPTEYLNNMGVFDCRVLAAHCIHISDLDIDIFDKNNAAVSYNPVSNMKLVSGIMPYKKLKQKGVLLSLGTDGAQSNNTLDLLRDLRTGILLQKLINDDATFINAEEAVRLVTIEGARALGMDDKIGSLEVGKQADLIAVDMNKPQLQPFHKNMLKNVYASIAYTISGADITDSMVGGQWLMRERNVLSFNADTVVQNARKASEAILKSAGLL